MSAEFNKGELGATSFQRVWFEPHQLEQIEYLRQQIQAKEKPKYSEQVFMQLTSEPGKSVSFEESARILYFDEEINEDDFRRVISNVRTVVLEDTDLVLYSTPARAHRVFPKLQENLWYWSPDEVPYWVPEEFQLAYWCTMAFKVSVDQKGLVECIRPQDREIFDALVMKHAHGGDHILEHSEMIRILYPPSEVRNILKDKDLLQRTIGDLKKPVSLLRNNLDKLGIIEHEIKAVRGVGYRLNHLDLRTK